MNELLGLAMRVSLMYVYMLVMLRISGKRSIGNISPLDFVVATIIGDMFDDVFWSEVPFSQALVGISTIVLMHTLLSYAQHKYDWLERLVNSTPAQVVHVGQVIWEGMRRERTNEAELRFELRMQGVEDLVEVHAAYWEPEGQISVIKTEAAETVQKQDIPRILERFK